MAETDIHLHTRLEYKSTEPLPEADWRQAGTAGDLYIDGKLRSEGPCQIYMGHPVLAAALSQPIGDLPEARFIGVNEHGPQFNYE